MKIFKFGGASVKDAESVQNVTEIIRLFEGAKLLVVVSAMGKTTNALEIVVDALCKRDKAVFDAKIDELKAFHFNIVNQLFHSEEHSIYGKLNAVFHELESRYRDEIPDNYNYEYDQIVSVGEVLSTIIVNAYINECGFSSQWIDARRLIRTNNTFRDAEVDWKRTEELVQTNVLPLFKPFDILITQGFIGHTAELLTTTLGREGSDFTAGIFAYCLNAESVTIWKDVAGVLNADPRYFKNATLLEQISYREAIELAFYGASVIHPKTLQPLQRKEIPFFVKSFLNPTEKGTSISKGADLVPTLPCYIVKKNQHLISVSSKDFSFIMEEGISFIFSLLDKYKTKVHLIQNSAISFSVCVDDKFFNLSKLSEELSEKFVVTCNENVSLYTIRHFDDKSLTFIEPEKVLLKQISKETVQIVVS